jgi:hypothetical protein
MTVFCRVLCGFTYTHWYMYTHTQQILVMYDCLLQNSWVVPSNVRINICTHTHTTDDRHLWLSFAERCVLMGEFDLPALSVSSCAGIQSTYVYVYLCIHACMYACMRMHPLCGIQSTYVYACMRVCICILYIYIYSCMHAGMKELIYACMYVYIHIRNPLALFSSWENRCVHTCRHTYISIKINALKFPSRKGCTYVRIHTHAKRWENGHRYV